jgi:shikimate dehydrogenase
MPDDPVLTLADLEGWPGAEPALAVIGHPIAHSLSPPMHNAALSALARRDARFARWRYHRFDIPPADLAPALALMRARGFRGVNLTVPHKVLAFGLVARTDPAARPVGAVNTLLAGDGGWQGFNTDGYGLSESLHERLGRELAGSDVVLLGAGGAARGAAVECLARRCRSLSILNRTRSSLDSLLAILKPLAGAIPLSGEPPASAGYILINATSSGLKAGEAPPVDLAALPPPACVLDMIYNPPVTPLLAQARGHGIPFANGLSMLVHQGAKSLEIWTGAPAAETAPVMAAALGASPGR